MNAPVWVTGAGVVCAAGTGRDALTNTLRDGRSALAPVRALDDLAAGRVPAEVASARRLDRAASLLLTAAAEAWGDAGLDATPAATERYAVVEGSSLGPLADALTSHEARLAEDPPRAPRPSALVKFMTGAGGAEIARAHGIRGPVLHLCTGSASGMCAIGEAYDRILSGRVDVAIAGGAECPLHPEIVAHFAAAGILADRDGPHHGCRPFDRQRSGTALGEGAGVLVLESEAHARRRGARPLAFVRGFGFACEAYSAMSPDPAGRGVQSAVAQAMASVDASDVRWIKTHGTGTRLNDLAECRGLAAQFGDDLPRVPMTSLKPTLGHMLGASGAAETVATILALRAGFVPATLGTRELDPELPRCTVARQCEASRPGVALALAEGFGGRCAALALEAA